MAHTHKLLLHLTNQVDILTPWDRLRIHLNIRWHIILSISSMRLVMHHPTSTRTGNKYTRLQATH